MGFGFVKHILLPEVYFSIDKFMIDLYLEALSFHARLVV